MPGGGVRGRGEEARKWKLNEQETKTRPTLSPPEEKANVGFLIEQKAEEEACQSQAPPCPPPFHFISPKLCLGKGPEQLLEP